MTPEHALRYAVKVAGRSPCAKSKRGVVVFNEYKILSLGYNTPTIGVCRGTDECRMACPKICVHAEQTALLSAAFEYGEQRATRPWDTSPIELLHVKVTDNVPVPSGPPSCAECSKLILASHFIERVWLLHEQGLVSYTPQDFHRQTLITLGLPLFEDA